MSVYLDYNASAPIDLRVLNYMVDIYRHNIGNADSRTHDFGDNARQIVEKARGEVASILNINRDEVFFTSGATESNNLAIQGLRNYGIKEGKKHIVTTSIEHKAVLETAKAMRDQGFEVDFVAPNIDGRISAKQLLQKVRDDTLLVSVMHVNNETGIIQPVEEIGEYLSKKNILFHVDATQSFGKLVDELRSLKYDILSMSAHKIGGPQGIGALILKKKRYQRPPVKGIFYGGQQEHGIRPGTIPVALVAALGYACRLAEKEYKNNQEKCVEIKKRLVEILNNSDLYYEFNGNQEYCIPNTMNIYIKGVESEALMLSTKKYCGVSNGSACNTNSYSPSYVLSAMGTSLERIENSIRISWGADMDIEKVANSFSDLIEIARRLVW